MSVVSPDHTHLLFDALVYDPYDILLLFQFLSQSVYSLHLLGVNCRKLYWSADYLWG